MSASDRNASGGMSHFAGTPSGYVPSVMWPMFMSQRYESAFSGLVVGSESSSR